VVPFFLINLGMGLTPIRLRTFVWVSWLGMLPGTFLYVNAGQELGRIDAPGDVLSPTVLVSLALLGVVPLVVRLLIRWQIRPRNRRPRAGAVARRRRGRRGRAGALPLPHGPEMALPVREFSNAEYPEDPGNRSVHLGRYNGRSLKLVRQADGVRFDFILEPANPHAARVVWKDVDLALMTPGLPEWTKADPGLRRLALTDRQWNRSR